MSELPDHPKKRRKAVLLGLGLDSDGHKRITTGPNFALIGGSKETHEEMTEKAIRINEKLDARKKKLEEVSREEFEDIARSVGLRRAPSKSREWRAVCDFSSGVNRFSIEPLVALGQISEQRIAAEGGVVLSGPEILCIFQQPLVQ